MNPNSSTSGTTARGDPGEAPALRSLAHPMVRVEALTLRFGSRTALDRLSLEIGEGELFALLGPNGSGKSTLLRIVATLLGPTGGRAEVDGLDIAHHPAAVRHRLGVVFQSPGLDGKLSITENLRFQGYLYGLSGKRLSNRIADLLERFGLSERRRERVEMLSGGLKRRVELAKALLHHPPLLLLDEPSTGLDLAARLVFWDTLADLQASEGLTVVLTTHLMEEANRCGRVALLDEGRLVALDTPGELKRSLGETVLTVETSNPEGLAGSIEKRTGLTPTLQNGRLRLSGNADPALAAQLWEWFPGEIESIGLGRPTLGDVFLARTGHPIAPEGGGDDSTDSMGTVS